ncbi:ankyrin repeat protein [Colletotrichum karsti]|uniref:Ankyrin repeat protein n=1 Tax=Colletotrichum karsti TaxID=1095194 RepID=A0A9P6HYK4_9PEZI|nr:ankyrin repeat protein [Colletotrichum karsti]KAF9872799.1 ankyrin repeat protein [Colletotrichum karsti]
MAPQQYLDLCHDIRSRLVDKLERKDSESLRFATRSTAEAVLESHFLRLFFQSIELQPATLTEDQFVENIQSRRLHKFIAIIAYASCSVRAARTFTTKLAAAAVWPIPTSQERIRDVASLPSDRESLKVFFGGNDSNDADKFFGTQAIFCTVVLRQREEMTVKDRETQRLPYLEEELLGSGSFGRVFKVKIAKGHIEDRHTDEVSNKPRWVARKDYIVESPMDSGSRDEGDIMKMILSASKTCENILENLGTLRVDSPLGASPATYSLFMPLAACDLGAYMKKDKSTTIKTPKTRASLIRSAMGLATGLSFLHHELQTSDFDDVVCYHMDLKPSNILVFHDSSSGQERSIWKLSDFGMSRVKVRRRNHAEHEERDISVWFRPRRQPNEEAPSGTQNRRGQGTYLPRESFLAGKLMNTKSDVWSLGCVLSVFFAYLEGGSESVAEYVNDRLKDRRGTDEGFDGFFSENSFGKFTLHPAVKDWHRRLANKAGNRSPAEKKIVQTILSFLQDKALNLDQQNRCTARDVEKALKETMNAYRKLENSQAADEPSRFRRPSFIDRFRSPQSDTTTPVDRSIQQWRLPRDVFDDLKGCKIAPKGTLLVYWSDTRLFLFTSLSAARDEESTISVADDYSPVGSTFFWKSVALTERYLIATTTGGTFNCYIFDLEAGNSVDADLKTCYRVSLPFPEINNLSISPDHQNMVCTLQDMENDRLPGSLFQARVTELIESGQKLNTETSDWGSNGTNTPLNFPQPTKLSWPAEDVISISLRSQTDGYMVLRPELTQYDAHQVSIISFSLRTKAIDRFDLKPQGIDSNTAPLFTAFSELHNEAACMVIARERHIYKLRFSSGQSGDSRKELHKIIDKYRILKVMVSQKDDTLIALGTKRANHRIILLEIKMPTSKDPISLSELAPIPQLFDYDEFTVRLIDAEGKRHLLIAALVDINRYAIHKVILSGMQSATTIRT